MNLFSSQFYLRTNRLPLAGLVLSTGCLAGCAPTINLATPKPVKVDIGVRLDIYQKTAPSKVKNEQSNLTVAGNRRLRSNDIQRLKVDHVLGEDRNGYLELKTPPADATEAARVTGLMKAENADRAYLYLAEAQAESKPMEMIEETYAGLWRNRALAGEWVQKEDGTWTQK